MDRQSSPGSRIRTASRVMTSMELPDGASNGSVDVSFRNPVMMQRRGAHFSQPGLAGTAAVSWIC